MSDSILDRVPVVGGLGYIEAVRRLPARFQARVQAEPGNRYFPHAIAVTVEGEKVGYVAPEVARRYYAGIRDGGPLECPGRLAARSDHDTSGVELLVDFGGVPQPIE